mmetsp:Transcript_40712/g.132321  ORF Transcript_40712/g.132321 Transcript_40712/m.132321 type:complete len:318 (-) Transcript_40712:641-1594(-)
MHGESERVETAARCTRVHMPSSPPRAARSLGLLGEGQRGGEAVDGGDGLAYARRDGHDFADDGLAARRRLRVLPLERRALRRHAAERLLHPALRRDQRLELKAQLRLLLLQAQYLERTAQRQLGGRERLPRQRRQPRRLLLRLGRRLLCRLDLCLRRRLRRRRLRARAVEDGRPAEAAAVARRVAVQEGAVGGRQLEGRVVLLRVERDDAVDAEPREESHRPLCLPQVAELDEQRHTPPAAPRRGVALGDDRLEALPQLCCRVAAVAAAVVHVRARLVDLDEVGQRQAEAHAAQHPLQLVGGIAVRWMTHDRHSDRE